MSKLEQLIEDSFIQLSKEKSSLYYSQVDRGDSDIFNREVEEAYEKMRQLIGLSLLKNQLKLSDMPRESRMNSLEISGYFSILAHRYACDGGDVDYLTEVLSIMYDDAIYGVMNEIINQSEFHALICQWLNYIDYDKIEFKGDKNFERYFQEQKVKHSELFSSFGMEKNIHS